MPGAPVLSERLFIYANHTVSRNFPIPETFWPDNFSDPSSFPPRTAHPVILVDQKEEHYSLLEGFPVDRLGLEQTPFIKQLLLKRPGSCWTVTMLSSKY